MDRFWIFKTIGYGLAWKLGLSLTVLLPLPAMAQVSPVCQTELAHQIEAIIDQPDFQQSHWGILVQTSGTNPQTLYDRDSEHRFVPASNVKLLTTAAALTQLGADFRIQTTLYQVPSSTGETDLQIVGRGDPSFAEAQLEALAQQLIDRNIHQIDRLIANTSYFRGDVINPTWEWADLQTGYGAPATSLMLNQNAIGLTLIPQALHQPLQVRLDDPAESQRWQIVNESETVAPNAPEFVDVGRDWTRPILHVQGNLRVGSAAEPVAISVPQPIEHFLDRFQQVLANRDIQVKQTAITTITTDPLAESARPIARLNSAPLSELLQETNQQSNNLYAEALLRILGNEIRPESSSSLDTGIQSIKQVLAELQIEPNSYDLADGSGLSRQNSVSPQVLVATLQAMAASPNAAVYQDSLAQAGISGTLRNRFQNTIVSEKLWGKTGALTGAVALSGYLERENSSQLTLSILVNQTKHPLPIVQRSIDRIVELLARSDC